MKPLLIKSSPKPNESLYSVLHRSIIKYYDSVESILTLRNIRKVYNYIDANYSWSSEIQKFTKQSLNLDPNFFTLNQFDEIFFNEAPSQKKRSAVYDLGKVKYCKHCLIEDFYHRLQWDISFLTICTKHKEFFINRCQTCGRNISLKWLMRNRCVCGSSYTGISISIDVIDEEHLNIQKHIEHLILDKKSFCQLSNNEMLNTKDFFTLLILFFQLLNHSSVRNPLFQKWINFREDTDFDWKDGKNRDLNMMTLLTTAAYHLLTNPLENFSLLMKSIDDIENMKDSNGKGTRLRKYSVLKQIISHPKGTIYHGAYSHYVSELNDEYTNKRLSVRPTSFKKQYVPINEAIKELKVSYKTFKQLCSDKTIKMHETIKRGHNVMLVDKASIETYKESKEKMMHIMDICDYLHVDFRIVHQLIDKELLSSGKKLHVNETTKLYFEREKVELFLQSIIDKSILIEDLDDSWIPIKKVMHLIRKSLPDPNYVDILLEILQGSLKSAIFKEQINLKGLFVLKSSVEEFNELQITKRIYSLGYIPREAKKILHYGLPKIHELMDKGILEVKHTVKNRNGTLTHYISKESIEKYLIDKNIAQ